MGHEGKKERGCGAVQGPGSSIVTNGAQSEWVKTMFDDDHVDEEQCY